MRARCWRCAPTCAVAHSSRPGSRAPPRRNCGSRPGGRRRSLPAGTCCAGSRPGWWLTTPRRTPVPRGYRTGPGRQRRPPWAAARCSCRLRGAATSRRLPARTAGPRRDAPRAEGRSPSGAGADRLPSAAGAARPRSASGAARPDLRRPPSRGVAPPADRGGCALSPWAASAPRRNSAARSPGCRWSRPGETTSSTKSARSPPLSWQRRGPSRRQRADMPPSSSSMRTRTSGARPCVPARRPPAGGSRPLPSPVPGPPRSSRPMPLHPRCRPWCGGTPAGSRSGNSPSAPNSASRLPFAPRW